MLFCRENDLFVAKWFIGLIFYKSTQSLSVDLAYGTDAFKNQSMHKRLSFNFFPELDSIHEYTAYNCVSVGPGEESQSNR